MPLIKTLRWMLINLIIFSILLEVISFLYIQTIKPNIYGFSQKPTYLQWTWENSYEQRDPLGPHLIDTLIPWCTIHPSGGMHRQYLADRQIEMSFNDDGFRGGKSEKSDSSNHIFLGDSFTEGWGLREDQTIPAVFSKLSSKPVVNLGMSGFGTTQMSILYDSMANTFAHKKVFVLLHLGNDFLDNDISLHDEEHPDTYRVYRADSNDLSLLRYRSSPDSSIRTWKQYVSARKEGFRRLDKYGLKSVLTDSSMSLPKRILQLTYSMRTLSLLYQRMKLGDSQGSGDPEELKYDSSALKILSYDLEKILEKAALKQAEVVVTNLPSWKLMYESARNREVHQRYLALEQQLAGFVSGRGGKYISVYADFKSQEADLDEIFLWLDGHYTPMAAEGVASLLAQ